jgi:hypothetical protein
VVGKLSLIGLWNVCPSSAILAISGEVAAPAEARGPSQNSLAAGRFAPIPWINHHRVLHAVAVMAMIASSDAARAIDGFWIRCVVFIALSEKQRDGCRGGDSQSSEWIAWDDGTWTPKFLSATADVLE